MMFSVVIPLYNKRTFILSTINSVLVQDCRNFEVIVVDDGSTDGSANIVASISDPRIRLLRQCNQGVGSARNTGIRESTNPWIAFLDADDLWAPNHLSALRATITAWPEAGFVSTQSTIIEGEDSFASQHGLAVKEIETRAVDFFAWVIDEPRYFHTSSVAARRDVLLSLGGFAEFQPGQDVELWVRLALATPSAVAMITTDGRRLDKKGITALAQLHVATRDLHPGNLPTPVLRLLDQQLRSAEHLSSRDSIERYFDYRLQIGMRAALSSGDRWRVWKLWRLMRAPYRGRPLLHLAATAAPRSLIKFAGNIRRQSSGIIAVPDQSAS